MKILGIDLGPSRNELLNQNKKLERIVNEQIEKTHDLQAMATAVPMNGNNYSVLPQYRVNYWDGEKNDGSLGPIMNYVPRYYDLATRSWSIYVTSDIAKTVIDKWVTWIISQGLNLKSNPIRKVLESEGIMMTDQEVEKFNDLVEARFSVWANSTMSSYSGEESLNSISKSVFMSGKIGGDVLVIMRYENGTVNVQAIDGRRIIHPGITADVKEGNVVFDGIEINERGGHEAYWVRGKNGEPKRIPAYDETTGLRCAFLYKGSKWSLDYKRGIPVIATVMESIAKLDRYKEAIVGNAEEIAKIIMQVVHEERSDGSNPFSGNGVLARFQPDGAKETLPVDDLGDQLAKRIQATYDKAVVNMGKNQRLEPVQPSTSIREFQPFYETNSHIICAAVGIPPNVAFSLYTDSFSASRAATKDWDHTIDVERGDFNEQFYSYVYKFWLFTEIMKGKINAPGFTEAWANKNRMVTESYTNARFTGPHFPHIDPLKEVNAERAKLGSLADSIPLTTIEQAVEALGGGDSDSNMVQFSDEIRIANDLGLKAPEPAPINPAQNTGNQ